MEYGSSSRCARIMMGAVYTAMGSWRFFAERNTRNNARNRQPKEIRPEGAAEKTPPPYQKNHEEGNGTPAKVCRTQSAR